jgi:nucleotide-binding universal stress UspA family protein
MGLIVVGVDRSAGARAALAFAHTEALLRQATLRIVHAWDFPYIAGALGMAGAMPVSAGQLEELRSGAELAIEQMLRETLPGTEDVTVEQRVLEGTPAVVLVEQSRDADLLVVGSRGHGGFAQLLLGSVSQQCAQHAECPVVIVRPQRDAR